MKRDPYGFVNTTLDRYDLLELVGMGGMGVVYRAQHSITKGPVAVKVLKPDLALQHPTMHEYFFEEAKKTVSLNHPYIIKISDTGITADGTAYLVMEWLDGHTLEEEMKEHGVIELERVSRLLEQIGSAAAHAHSKGIIHRDLKPGNIMIVKDYQGEEAVKIVDFGIAKALTSTMGAVSRVLGAPYYASPEQLVASAEIDHRSDIYTLGVILHQMLTGKLPFDSDTNSVEAMIRKHTQEPPPPIRQLRPELPEALERVILRALAKRPADRYQSAVELARAFRRAASLETGTIEVQCLDAETGDNLPGATIYINGKSVGQTDEAGRWAGKDFVSGKYLVEVDCVQYLPWSTWAQASASKEVVVTAQLAPTHVGELSISTVAGAEVFLDGIKIGTTDQVGRLSVPDLPLGPGRVEIKHPKYHPAASQVEIIEGKVWHCEVKLTPLPRRRPIREFTQKVIAPIKSLRSASVRYCGECGAAVRKGMGSCNYCKTPVDETLFNRDWSFKALAESIRRNFLRRKLVVVAASSLVVALLILGGIFLFAREKPASPVVEVQPRPSPLTTPQNVVPTPTPHIPPKDMVYVPSGTFTPGRADEPCQEFGKPPSTVTVGPFDIDKYEVTNEQYAEFIEANPKQPPPSTWINGKYAPGTARMPVTGVSWKQANDYANWAGKSLPTEEEWEFSARGEDGFTYPWGNEWDPNIVNAEKKERKFDEVGIHPANRSPFGAYDMVGNAWEWTASDLTNYPGSEKILPADTYRVLRGGSWETNRKMATTTCRLGWRSQRVDNPGTRTFYCDPNGDYKVNNQGFCDYSNMGFRCIKRVKP